MPIFCFDVNLADDGKLVPITHQISNSIEPAAEALVLRRVEEYPRMGPSGNVRLFRAIEE